MVDSASLGQSQALPDVILIGCGHPSIAQNVSHAVATHRRRAILTASVIDLETRLTDALLDMVDKLIGGMFSRAQKSIKWRYVSRKRDVSRLMRLFDGTINALEISRKPKRHGFTVMGEMVGWSKLEGARGDVRSLADLVEEDPLVGAAGAT